MGNGASYITPPTKGGKPLKITVKVAESTSDYSGNSSQGIWPPNKMSPENDTNRSLKEDMNKSIYGSLVDDSEDDIIASVRKNIIGREATFNGPFGSRYIVYCDFVASGKAIRYIEDFIGREVLPYYGNTHTTTSYSAIHTASLREEARSIILHSVNGGDQDVVIFTGSGTTAAIHKLITVLNIKNTKTAVFITPFEHHSNILPWRTLGVEVVRIGETLEGEVDVADLTFQLKRYKSRGYKLISSMSAASNVTGILVKTDRITEAVHKMGGLAFWDYACAGPYIPIDMNPNPKAAKDAIFLSTHKFLGGVGTPGLLIAKRELFQNEVPGAVGGGTVAFVTKKTESYLHKTEEREEGGTPAIVESIRAGLTFQLKETIGAEWIEEQEQKLTQKAFERWKHCNNLFILGGHTAKRLPIFSFLIGHPPSGKFLHHNFVSILLNDLYGIQARGGCACAGPYAQDLLCMTEQQTALFTPYLEEVPDKNGKMPNKAEVLKPGFTRLNLPYFMEEDTVDYVLHAVTRVASEGWKLLPFYQYDAVSGAWTHREDLDRELPSLMDAQLKDIHRTHRPKPEKQDVAPPLQDVAAIAEKMFANAEAKVKKLGLNLRHEKIKFAKGQEKIIWFLEPKVALLYLRSRGGNYIPETPRHDLPFMVRSNTLLHTQEEFKNNMLEMGYKIKDGVGLKPMFMSTFKGEEMTKDKV